MHVCCLLGCLCVLGLIISKFLFFLGFFCEFISKIFEFMAKFMYIYGRILGFI